MVEEGFNDVVESAWYGHVDAQVLVHVFSFKIAFLCNSSINLDCLVASSHESSFSNYSTYRGVGNVSAISEPNCCVEVLGGSCWL